MESEDDSDYYNKAILYNDDLKGLDGDGSDGDLLGTLIPQVA